MYHRYEAHTAVQLYRTCVACVVNQVIYCSASHVLCRELRAHFSNRRKTPHQYRLYIHTHHKTNRFLLVLLRTYHRVVGKAARDVCTAQSTAHALVSIRYTRKHLVVFLYQLATTQTPFYAHLAPPVLALGEALQ